MHALLHAQRDQLKTMKLMKEHVCPILSVSQFKISNNTEDDERRRVFLLAHPTVLLSVLYIYIYIYIYIYMPYI